ncbi:MAG: diaminopimelate decarboxylase [Ignavibacteria bacterium]|jgi:diaminopimelate decarboxylase|nr:diaminopimelate decarboxylase [Ignavibacteria bacterium]MCU7502735.1 diaminopimelate decarboxylase [Ignavibacteria bacterium]MCU7517336.1 diaminopimelate decarboxylase [Ignavibacteria bacterium]
MDFFEIGTFHYMNNKLYCEHKAVEEIIEEVGTPAYIYSKKHFADQYRTFDEAFKDVKHAIFFAAKANFNLNVLKTFADLGAGIDVNSAGELYRAMKIGVDPSRIILSGVGKTAAEIKLALEHNIKLIKAESFEELLLINKVAGEANTVAHVALRINPNVDPKTHPYISTGLAENKFGIDASEAENVYLEGLKLENVMLTGLDMHIGSQITTIAPYAEAIGKMAELFKKIKSKGVPLQHFDVGGGMGVRYKNENLFLPSDLAEAVKDVLKDLNCEIMFEPGRYLTANGGILVAEVLYTKKNREKNFIIVDASMTELIRPSLYSAYHHVQPIKLTSRKDIKADIVGPVCESGDFLAKNRTIQECVQGDKLAVMTAGAYGMVMSSNYNGRRRPPEVLVDGDKFYVIRSRESFEHMLWDEELIK